MLSFNNKMLPITNSLTALQILTDADRLESLFIDEDSLLSEKGLAYLIVFYDEKSTEFFQQLLKESKNPVAEAYALLGLYQQNKQILTQLDQYNIDISLAVNLKLNCSLFIGMRLADFIDEIKQDQLHQQVIWGHEKLFNSDQ